METGAAGQQFKIRNEDYAARTRDSFARQSFMSTLGARVINVGPGIFDIQIDREPGLLQQHGFFHGGAIGALADTVGGYAAFTLMERTDSVVTIEYKMNIISPARGDALIARGRVVRPGRRVTVCKAEVFSRENGAEVPCAVMLGTFMVLANTPDE